MILAPSPVTHAGAPAAVDVPAPLAAQPETPMYARGGPRPEPGTLNQLFFEAVEK